MVASEIEDSVQLLLSGEVSKWKERTAKWIDPETGLFRDTVKRKAMKRSVAERAH